MKIIKTSLKVLLVVCLLLIAACTINNQLGNCAVKGHVQGLGTILGFVTGGSNNFDESFFKLILIVDGSFSFKAALNQPGGGRIFTPDMFFKLKSGRYQWMRSRVISFDINPQEHIVIEGKLKPYFIDYRITGNELAEQASVFRQKYGYLLDKETRLALAIDSLTTNRAKQHSIDSTTAEFDQLRERYNAERVKYAISHPSLAIAASYLQMQPEDTIKKYFPRLSDHIKSSPIGRSLQQRIAVLEIVAPGKAAPLFTARTAEGKTFALERLRGKYVLLDFWGSWCGPCLSGFPQMKARHRSHKDRLTIVGIACRDNKAAWLKAIQEQELPWTQLLDSPEAALANQYGVSAYPTKILIDPQGTLLYITKGEDIGFYKVVDQIVNNAK